MSEVNILVMTDYDGDITYYSIDEEYVDWVARGLAEDIPESLVEKFESQSAYKPTREEVTYLQVLALDDNFLGSKINDVIEHAQGATIVEHHGQWF